MAELKLNPRLAPQDHRQPPSTPTGQTGPKPRGGGAMNEGAPDLPRPPNVATASTQPMRGTPISDMPPPAASSRPMMQRPVLQPSPLPRPSAPKQ